MYVNHNIVHNIHVSKSIKYSNKIDTEIKYYETKIIQG